MDETTLIFIPLAPCVGPRAYALRREWWVSGERTSNEPGSSTSPLGRRCCAESPQIYDFIKESVGLWHARYLSGGVV